MQVMSNLYVVFYGLTVTFYESATQVYVGLDLNSMIFCKVGEKLYFAFEIVLNDS